MPVDHAFSQSDDLAPFPTLLLPRTSSCLSFSATRLCSLLTGEWEGRGGRANHTMGGKASSSIIHTILSGRTVPLLENSCLLTYDLYDPVRNAFDAGKAITKASGRGLGPGNRNFSGPCEMA
jgi:hypothetical protein